MEPVTPDEEDIDFDLLALLQELTPAERMARHEAALIRLPTRDSRICTSRPTTGSSTCSERSRGSELSSA